MADAPTLRGVSRRDLEAVVGLLRDKVLPADEVVAFDGGDGVAFIGAGSGVVEMAVGRRGMEEGRWPPGGDYLMHGR